MLNPQIIFEDDDLIVINKPSGLVVNRSETISEVTLQDWMMNYAGKSFIEGESDFYKRTGIVHRLDKQTSGVLIIAKNEKSFVALQAQFKAREVSKKYTALVHGDPENEGTISGQIARVGAFGKFGMSQTGRESETYFRFNSRLEMSQVKIQELFEKSDTKLNKNQKNYYLNNGLSYSLLDVFPKTGRTHQIRVHMKSIAAPIVSDELYGPRKLLKLDALWCPRLFLHAEKISFTHPTKLTKVEYSVELPRDLKDALKTLIIRSL